MVDSFLEFVNSSNVIVVDFFFVAVVEKRNLQDKEDENIRLAEREAALVRLDCPYSRDDVNHFVCFNKPSKQIHSCMLFFLALHPNHTMCPLLSYQSQLFII